MTFEDRLRAHVHRQAEAIRLPARDPERAVAGARSRRRRRQAAAGAGAVIAVVALAAGVVPALDGDDGEREPDVVAGISEALPATGPLTFDWHATGDGLYRPLSSFQAEDGTVYALSTGPGFVRSDADRASAALYRLDDDGVWRSVDLESGGRPFALDVAANGDALYAVSTGPGAGGDDSVAQLSASTDGGDTWASEDVPPPDPPSDLAWERSQSLSVETVGDTTIALVTTFYRLDLAASFPELGDHGLGEAGEDEVVIMPSVPPEDGAPAMEGGLPAGTRTLTWAELGVSGPEDLVVHEVLRNTGAGWEPVEATGLPDDASVLGAAGGKFVITGYDVGASVSISDDGASWAPLPLPEPEPDESLMDPFYDVHSFGSALVALEERPPLAMEGGATRVLVSTDAGSTWQPVDLTAAGIAADSYISSIESGPLGVVLVARPSHGDPVLVVSGDLVEWTATPVADVAGEDAIWNVDVTVGADRIVVTSTEQPVDEVTPVGSRTAVGTLVRD